MLYTSQMIDHAKSILPKDYSPKDLYFLGYPSDNQILCTLQDPFNFTRYFWKLHVEYLSWSSVTFEDPATWLFHTINEIGTEITKWYMRFVLQNKTNDERLLSDLSFLLYVDGSVLNSDVLFGHCFVNDRTFLEDILSACGVYKPWGLADVIISSTSNSQVMKFKLRSAL